MENINQLYRPMFMRIYTLKDGTIITYENTGSYYLKYGVIDNKYKELSTWEDLLSDMGYKKEFQGKTNRKGRVWCEIDYTDKHYNRCQRKLYKDEFNKGESYLKIRIFKPKDVMMRQLVEELSAEEFILFLKDNEIKYMPSIK